MVAYESLHLTSSPGKSTEIHQGEGGLAQGEDPLDHVADRVLVATSQVQELANGLGYTCGEKRPDHVLHMCELPDLGSVGHGIGRPGERGIDGGGNQPWAGLAGSIGQKRPHDCGQKAFLSSLLQYLERRLGLCLRVRGDGAGGLILDKGRGPVSVLIAGPRHKEARACSEAGGRHEPGSSHNRGGQGSVRWNSLWLDRGGQVHHQVGGSLGECLLPPTRARLAVEFHPVRCDALGHGVVLPRSVDRVAL